MVPPPPPQDTVSQMDTLLQPGTGIYPQGSATGKTIRKELGLQAAVSSKAAEQTKKLRTESKTTKDHKKPRSARCHADPQHCDLTPPSKTVMVQ